jgi:hypothetical protein
MATAVVTQRAAPMRRHEKRPNLPRIGTRASTVEAVDLVPSRPTPHGKSLFPLLLPHPPRSVKE